MNERIKELEEQAAVDSWEGQAKFIEKFVELIIRECADIAHVHSEGSEPHDEGRVYYYSEDIADKIKQHFGMM